LEIEDEDGDVVFLGAAGSVIRKSFDGIEQAIGKSGGR